MNIKRWHFLKLFMILFSIQETVSTIQTIRISLPRVQIMTTIKAIVPTSLRQDGGSMLVQI